MEALIGCFAFGFLHHADLSEALQAMYLARTEMRSKNRWLFVEYTKTTGEYEAEYEW